MPLRQSAPRLRVGRSAVGPARSARCPWAALPKAWQLARLCERTSSEMSLKRGWPAVTLGSVTVTEPRQAPERWKLEWADLYNEVVTSGLCTGCAACIVACPHDVLGYNTADGVYRPFHLEEELGPGGCSHGLRGCTSCTRACPRFQELGNRSRHLLLLAGPGYPKSSPASRGRSCWRGRRTPSFWPPVRTGASCLPCCCGASSTTGSTRRSSRRSRATAPAGMQSRQWRGRGPSSWRPLVVVTPTRPTPSPTPRPSPEGPNG